MSAPPRLPRPVPPQLQQLTQLANQIRQGITTKSQNVTRFTAALKDRIRTLDQLSVEIYRKIQAIGGRGVAFQQAIAQQTAQIADLNRQLREATEAQAAAARQVQQLTGELQQARGEIAQTAALRQEIGTLQQEVQQHTHVITNLTQGIDAANAVISQALMEISAPEDTAELNQLLSQLEAHVAQINSEIDRVNAGSNGSPPPPPPTSGGGRGRRRKTKQAKRTLRKTKKNI